MTSTIPTWVPMSPGVPWNEPLFAGYQRVHCHDQEERGRMGAHPESGHAIALLVRTGQSGIMVRDRRKA